MFSENSIIISIAISGDYNAHLEIISLNILIPGLKLNKEGD